MNSVELVSQENEVKSEYPFPCLRAVMSGFGLVFSGRNTRPKYINSMVKDVQR